MTDQNSTYEDQFDWDNATGGGLLKEYTATIGEVEFGVDEEYRDDTVRLMADLTVLSHEDPDSNVEPGDTFSEAWNVGNTSTWEASPDGATVSRVDGKRPRFNSSSGYGRLLESVQPGNKTAIEGADKLIEILRTRGPATKASIWNGLTFKFERLPFSFENDEGETVNYERVYPTAFLGEGDVQVAKAEGKTAPATTETAPSTDGPSRADLVALAAQHEQFAKFLSAAMKEYPGVEDGELAEDLMSEEGIFAEAHS